MNVPGDVNTDAVRLIRPKTPLGSRTHGWGKGATGGNIAWWWVGDMDGGK